MMRNFSMFWRIVRRLLTSNYSRLFVILLALGAGAAITSALLNLQIDAKRRLTSEFRSLGANVVLASRANRSGVLGSPQEMKQPATLDEVLLTSIPSRYEGKPVAAAGFLYVIGEVGREGGRHFAPVVVAGTRGSRVTEIIPGVRIEAAALTTDMAGHDACAIGGKVASQFKVRGGEILVLRNEGREATCRVASVFSTGGPEDAQIFTNLSTTQTLANLPGQISLVQMSVTGTPAEVRQFIAQLSAQIPDADVRGIKQLAEAEGKLYDRISGLLTATVILVLLLTSLCVMAGMSNVAIERKNDVGLMKAIGGSVRRVVRLFLVEAILMGIAGGVVGSAIGLVASIWLGKAVFGVAAQPRWIVYPVSVAVTVVVSIASAYPLRRLAHIRPASVFRGEA